MNIAIEAKLRETKKKSDLNQLRAQEFIPAVIYKSGSKAGEDGLKISLVEADFTKAYRKSIGEISFFIVKLDNKEYRTIIKDKQVHPVSRKVMHIDFLELVPDKKVTMRIPLKFFGDPKGLKEGGKLEILVRSLSITCLPDAIPEEVKIDLSDLAVGQSIHFQDLTLENIQSKLPGNTVLARIKGAVV